MQVQYRLMWGPGDVDIGKRLHFRSYRLWQVVLFGRHEARQAHSVVARGSFLSETAAIVRYLDQALPGRRVTGETALEQGLDAMWDNRVWVHILYRITTAFHVLHQGLGPKLELTSNPAWGEHCRKEALAHASLVNQHLSDGRAWLLGGDAPTFSDITMATAIAFSKFPANAPPLDERFEHINAFWKRWQERPAFQAAYADRQSGVAEIDER